MANETGANKETITGTESTTGGFDGGNIGTGSGPEPSTTVAEFGNTGGNPGGETEGRKRGRPAKNGGDRNTTGGETGNNSDGQGGFQVQTERLNESVEFPTLAKRPRTPKTGRPVIKAEQIAPTLHGALFVIGQTRPPYLREAYDLPIDAVMPIAEPLAKMLEELPEKYYDAAVKMVNPIALIVASYGLYSVIVQREKQLHVAFTEFSAGERANVGTGNNEREPEIVLPDRPANPPAFGPERPPF